MKCVVDVAKTDIIYKLYPKRKQKNTTVLKLIDYAPYSMLLYSAAERDRERINR